MTPESLRKKTTRMWIQDRPSFKYHTHNLLHSIALLHTLDSFAGSLVDCRIDRASSSAAAFPKPCHALSHKVGTSRDRLENACTALEQPSDRTQKLIDDYGVARILQTQLDCWCSTRTLSEALRASRRAKWTLRSRAPSKRLSVPNLMQHYDHKHTALSNNFASTPRAGRSACPSLCAPPHPPKLYGMSASSS